MRSAPLGPAELDHYAAHGWVSVPGFFGAADAERIQHWTDEVAGLPEVPGRQMVYYERAAEGGARLVQRIENFCPYHAGFDALMQRGRLMQAIEQLLEGPACLFKEKINFKLPGGAGFEPHQDQQAGWSRYAPIFVTALICIDRTTIANGCLEMANSPRFDKVIGEEWRPLSAEEMASFALHPIEAAPGDVLFFDSYAPHGSKPNHTDQPRRILYLTYNRRADGDHRIQYFADKRASFPPDIERPEGVEYKFRV